MIDLICFLWQQSDDKEKGKKERYRNVVRKWDKDTGTYEDVDLGDAGSAKVDDGEIAFTFRRVLNQDPASKDGYSEIDIEAQGLRELLKESIGGDYPGQNFDGDTVNMGTPFPPLVSRISSWSDFQATSFINHGIYSTSLCPMRRYIRSLDVNS